MVGLWNKSKRFLRHRIAGRLEQILGALIDCKLPLMRILSSIKADPEYGINVHEEMG